MSLKEERNKTFNVILNGMMSDHTTNYKDYPYTKDGWNKTLYKALDWMYKEFSKQDKGFLKDLKKEMQMGHTCEMFCPHSEMIKQVDRLSGYYAKQEDSA